MLAPRSLVLFVSLVTWEVTFCGITRGPRHTAHYIRSKVDRSRACAPLTKKTVWDSGFFAHALFLPKKRKVMGFSGSVNGTTKNSGFLDIGFCQCKWAYTSQVTEVCLSHDLAAMAISSADSCAQRLCRQEQPPTRTPRAPLLEPCLISWKAGISCLDLDIGQGRFKEGGGGTCRHLLLHSSLVYIPLLPLDPTPRETSAWFASR